MHTEFILEITELVAQEHGLDAHKVGEQFVTEWRELRELDPDLWEEVTALPRLDQQNLIRRCLILQEIGVELAVLSLATPLILYWAFRGPVGHATFAALHHLGRGFQTVGEWLGRLGSRWRFRYAVIMQNLERCYRACGLDPEDVRRQLTSFSYLTFTRWGEKVSSDVREKSLCLARCYGQYLIELIGMLSEAYIRCLKDAGSFDKVKDLDRSDVLRLPEVMFGRTVCVDYQKPLRESVNNFFRFLEILPRPLRTELTERLAAEMAGKLEQEKQKKVK